MMQSARTESNIAFHLQFRATLQTHLLAASRGKGHSGMQGLLLLRYGHKRHQPQGPPPAGKHGKRFSWHLVRGALASEGEHKEGQLQTWHPPHPEPSPRWLHPHFLICDAEMNRTNLPVEDCEELQIKVWNNTRMIKDSSSLCYAHNLNTLGHSGLFENC